MEIVSYHQALIYSTTEVRRYGTDYFHWKKTANLFKAHWSSLGPYIQFVQANFQTRTFIAYQVRVDIDKAHIDLRLTWVQSAN